jgi:gluconate 2-dehydrogenase gamma chain
VARQSGSPAFITTRRSLLAGAGIACCINFAGAARARIVKNGMPWWPDAGDPPKQVNPGAWHFFTAEEGSAIEALVDRLIPPDPKTPGAKDAGVAVYIDAQLAGPYGDSRGLYMRPPFHEGGKEQGPQSALTPAGRYRQTLAALEKYCKAKFAGKAFKDIPDAQKDELLHGLEKGSVQLEQTSGKAFFEMLWKNTKEGFFADPVYGGNRDMVGWKMIGFPGARYDYRDWVMRHNETYPRPPMSIGGHRSSNAGSA